MFYSIEISGGDFLLSDILILYTEKDFFLWNTFFHIIMKCSVFSQSRAKIHADRFEQRDFLKAVFIPLSVLSFIKDHCNNKVVNRVVNKVVKKVVSVL